MVVLDSPFKDICQWKCVDVEFMIIYKFIRIIIYTHMYIHVCLISSYFKMPNKGKMLAIFS